MDAERDDSAADDAERSSKSPKKRTPSGRSSAERRPDGTQRWEPRRDYRSSGGEDRSRRRGRAGEDRGHQRGQGRHDRGHRYERPRREDGFRGRGDGERRSGGDQYRGRSQRRDGDQRGDRRSSRPPQDQRVRAPFVPDEVEYHDLDKEVRARLRTLSKENAERVGRHLVMAGELLETDPELAYEHAQAAVRRAGRVDVVREAAALTAYATGRYAEALREFRTVRRLSGVDLHRAAEADCERGLGRPERALEVIAEAPKNLPVTARAELAIVAAGARLDLEQPEMALIVIEEAPRTTDTWERVDELRADILERLGRHEDAARVLASLPTEEDDLISYDDLAAGSRTDARAEAGPEKDHARQAPPPHHGPEHGDAPQPGGGEEPEDSEQPEESHQGAERNPSHSEPEDIPAPAGEHDAAPAATLTEVSSSVAASVDGVLLDLDGVVYRGPHPVPHAIEAVTGAGVPIGYITNNASRTPEEVAEHLRELGLPAAADQVTTAAQAAAELIAETYGPGSKVLVVGGHGLRQAVTDRQLQVVTSSDDGPAVVVQGMSQTLTWTDLAEGVYAITGGADLVATNLDATMPTERGMAPGNGALVQVMVHATGVQPRFATGKPDPQIVHSAAARAGLSNPVVVGDRLDTDIQGARAAGVAAMLVLTGVDGPAEVLNAAPEQRPTLVARDLRGLLEPHPRVFTDGTTWYCRDAAATFEGGELTVREDGARVRLTGEGEARRITLDALRAACEALWEQSDPPTITRDIHIIDAAGQDETSGATV